MTATIGLHVSPARYTDSILMGGLFSEIGDRAEALGESSPGVYLFTNESDIEQAINGWFGKWFTGMDLAVFTVDYSGLRYDVINVGNEIMVTQDIPADRITHLKDILA